MTQENQAAEGGAPFGLSFLLLPSAALPTLEALNAALAARGVAPASPGPPSESPEGEEVAQRILVCEFEGADAFVSLMPAPFPWADLQGPAETAWWWPEATTVLQGHTAHLVVALRNTEGDALDQSLRLTRFSAGLAEAAGALGIYWGSGPLVHSRAAFVADSAGATREDVPVHLWVDPRLFSTREGTVSVFTSGLATFGAMEIEIRESSDRPEDLLELVFGLSSYLIRHGPVIKDGDTVGGTPEEQIVARHLPSEWEREGLVLVLEF